MILFAFYLIAPMLSTEHDLTSRSLDPIETFAQILNKPIKAITFPFNMLQQLDLSAMVCESLHYICIAFQPTPPQPSLATRLLNRQNPPDPIQIYIRALITSVRFFSPMIQAFLVFDVSIIVNSVVVESVLESSDAIQCAILSLESWILLQTCTGFRALSTAVRPVLNLFYARCESIRETQRERQRLRNLQLPNGIQNQIASYL